MVQLALLFGLLFGLLSGLLLGLLPGRVLTGDSLLIGSCGRTDLPTSAATQMYDTLERLARLPDDTVVYPGHDYKGRRASTIGQERKHNPRLAAGGREAFVDMMNARDTPVPEDMDAAIAANRQCLSG